ncbi:HET-domain-containing protein, partial [Mytilinidion resinicola]
VRLIISSEQTPRPLNYLALSHVWGKSQFTKLTTLNIQDLQKRISPLDLSRTFLDAITVARRLGVRYLWIDSLCILQDSPEDWRIESSMMHEVYKNSLCVIAASEASEPHQGLFKTRDTLEFTPFKVCFTPEDQPKDYYCLLDWWKDMRKTSPLSKRGWVVQERLLSPRTIHFATPMFWECRELVACEAYPHGLNGPRDRRTNKVWSKLPFSRWKDPLNLWDHTVLTYTKGFLTRPEDKLIAISGIARLFQSLFQDRYIAGLWSKELLRGLLWSVGKHDLGEDKKDTTRAKIYRAPSWSWASIDGEVTTGPWLFTVTKHLVDVLTTHILPLADDELGQISYGHIDLAGKLFKLPEFDGVLENVRVDDDDYDPWSFGLDDWSDLPSQMDITYFLPIAEVRDDVRRINLNFHGLLLQHHSANSGELTSYHRIGFARVDHNGSIAGTKSILRDWTEPPWPIHELGTVRLV